ncbi:MAG TPA: hypothetical protein EYN69_10155 [Flavobacteriales bacterium]|nr:hypothetical protein [Flavobacteriales bacterium]
MDELIDKYFQKARESISDPVPISEIKAKLIASTGANGSRKWLPTRFQVIIALAVVFIVLYIYIDSRLGREVIEVDGEGSQQEQVLASEDQQPIAEVTAEASDNALPDNTDQGALASQDGESSPDTRDNEALQIKEELVEAAVTSRQAESMAKPVAANTDDTEVPEPIEQGPPPQEKAKEPPKTKAEPVTKPATVDEPVSHDFVTKHEFLIRPSYSESRLKKLDKELSKFGVTIKIDALNYNKEKISKFKGTFVSINTNARAKFSVPGTFNKLILNFDYSKSKGPVNMVVTGN